MSVSSAGRASESSLPIVIPPIEIGSFAAPRPDKSEFIGSASGIFFTNTVFRSFATLIPAPNLGGPDDHGDLAAESRETQPAACPTDHGYVLPTENQEQDAEDAALRAALNGTIITGQSNASDDTAGQNEAGQCSYGVVVPGLGLPPSAAVAKSLLVNYFQHWHPFLPFLHGPTFFEQVNKFYEKPIDSPKHPELRIRAKLLRAVTFQCIFNVGSRVSSTPADQHDQAAHIPESCRITSTAALTSLLGVVSSGHDLPSLQALLAMEIYLMTRMELRAASTVHGTVTRILYHCGLHRCPFRYIQLPRDVCAIRQRIFWCAYILDRQLSQLLGHPPAIKDAEVDVCIPGMDELHNPVKPREPVPQSLDDDDGHEVTAHLPRGYVARQPAAAHEKAPDAPDSSIDGPSRVETGIDTESPARHHKRAPKEAGEFVLGYLVTYSRLSGAAFDLFHTSITNRFVTWDQVMELSSKIQSWWNGLPLSLQEESPSSPLPQYSSCFITLYHYIVLFINRPPLSLPTHRIEFRASIQSALSASRALIRHLESQNVRPAMFAWPTTLSTAWMAGLVVSFAALLNLYPFHKAQIDLHAAMSVLDRMGADWPSARHCRAAISTLLAKLEYRNENPPLSLPIAISASRDDSVAETAAGSDQPIESADAANESRRSRYKRRRFNTEGEPNVANSTNPTSQAEYVNGAGYNSLNTYASEFANRHPVLQYSGPDFGFDSATATNYQGGWENLLNQNFNLAPSGQFFNSDEWDMYMQSFGGRFDLQ